jgi:hypothetical protein
MDLSGKSTENPYAEQNDLMTGMKSTSEVAINAMESHIKSGTFLCLTSTSMEEQHEGISKWFHLSCFAPQLNP